MSYEPKPNTPNPATVEERTRLAHEIYQIAYPNGNAREDWNSVGFEIADKILAERKELADRLESVERELGVIKMANSYEEGRIESAARGHEVPLDTKAYAGKQHDQAKLGYVVCECGQKLPVRFAYKCWFCKLYLCSHCADEHFGESDEHKLRAAFTSGQESMRERAAAACDELQQSYEGHDPGNAYDTACYHCESAIRSLPLTPISEPNQTQHAKD